MRAHRLIGSAVLAADGEELGRVFDLEATATGPVVNEVVGRALELNNLLVGPAALVQRLGFHRRGVRGPAGFPLLTSRLTGYRIPWDKVDEIERHRIRLNCPRDELEKLTG